MSSLMQTTAPNVCTQHAAGCTHAHTHACSPRNQFEQAGRAVASTIPANKGRLQIVSNEVSKKPLSDALMKKISGLCSSQEDAELVLEFARECFQRGRNAAL